MSGAVPSAIASLCGYPNRVVGCLLGKMCGDVLGAGVEGWDHDQVFLAHPDGRTSFPNTERGFGCYTDDTQMAIALARSLVASGGRVDDVAAARAYADEFQRERGYGGTAFKILASIKQSGIDAKGIKTIGTKYIPGGSFGNGGAMRIAPVGLVYRNAPPAVLRHAVEAALRCTHVHPTAVDGAFVIALAVGYLATREAGGGPLPAPTPSPSPVPAAAVAAAALESAAAEAAAGSCGHHTGAAASGSAQAARHAGGATCGGTGGPQHHRYDHHRAGGTDGGGGGSGRGGGSGAVGVQEAGAAFPLGLLDHLLAHGDFLETEEMHAKLEAIRAALLSATAFKAPSQPWAEYFASPGWVSELQLHAVVSERFQICADDAAAAALVALCWHWSAPEDALTAAVHYGGDTDTIAAITGAMAGALHGSKWIPPRWFNNLENGPAGRDELLHLAAQLAQLDTQS